MLLQLSISLSLFLYQKYNVFHKWYGCAWARANRYSCAWNRANRQRARDPCRALHLNFMFNSLTNREEKELKDLAMLQQWFISSRVHHGIRIEKMRLCAMKETFQDSRCGTKLLKLRIIGKFKTISCLAIPEPTLGPEEPDYLWVDICSPILELAKEIQASLGSQPHEEFPKMQDWIHRLMFYLHNLFEKNHEHIAFGGIIPSFARLMFATVVEWLGRTSKSKAWHVVQSQ